MRKYLIVTATAIIIALAVTVTRIRECIAIKEAQASQQDIYSYSPKSNATADYTQLIQEILEKEI